MTMIDTSQMRPLEEAGYQLIPLHPWDRVSIDARGKKRNDGKRPRDGNWIRRPYDTGRVIEEAVSVGSNVGVRLRPGDLVIDYDPRNDPSRGEEPTSLSELMLWSGVDPTDWPTVKTGSGGLHIYLTKPADVAILDSLKEFPGVEFKTVGRQVVAPGSVHPCGNHYTWVSGSEDLWLDVPRVPETLFDMARRPITSASGSAEAGVYTAEELAEMLKVLDPQDFRDHDDWLKLMMACHHATAGGGLAEFVDWSTSDPEYADATGQIEQRWDSLRADQDSPRVTFKTLNKILIDAGQEQTIPRKSAEDDFEDVEEAEDGQYTDAASFTGVLEDWVFVAEAMRFVRRTDLKQFKTEQWNALYASLMPDQNIVSRVFKGKTPVPRYESMAYVPSAPELLGGSTYNLWRPSGVKAREGDFSIMEEHMEYLFPDVVERAYVMDFMHFVCCKPEVKLMFVPLIQGQQGTGKTALGILLKRIIGAANVAEPSPDELRERWTKWQEGASLAIVEELMTNGRLELANKLKPVITNETLRIEDKGMPLYSIPNHLNMLCFTNHRNAVRLEEGDRRWLVIFSPSKPQDTAYYRRLWAFIESPEGPAAWKHRLERHVPELEPKGRAPMTAAKLEMREASKTDVESTVAEWMESRTGPLCDDLFRFDDAWRALDRSSRPHKMALTLALKSVGCVQHPRQTNKSLPAVSLWSVTDHEKWEKAGAAERTKVWMAMQGFDTKEDFDLVN